MIAGRYERAIDAIAAIDDRKTRIAEMRTFAAMLLREAPGKLFGNLKDRFAEISFSALVPSLLEVRARTSANLIRYLSRYVIG